MNDNILSVTAGIYRLSQNMNTCDLLFYVYNTLVFTRKADCVYSMDKLFNTMCDYVVEYRNKQGEK